MKKKKILLILLISIITIITISIVILNKKSNYIIPNNYIKNVKDYRSYLDGSDIDYFIYSDKIIEQIVNYYPYGNPKGTYERKIIVYDNIKINNDNINDYLSIIENSKGKTILHISE